MQKIVFSVLLCLLFMPAASAKNVWILDIAGETPTAFLNIDVLEDMAIGDIFELRVNETSVYSIQIDEIVTSNNGDRSWYGSITNTGLDYALVITVGDQTAHLILTSPSGIFQLYGIKNGASSYSGNFSRLEHIRDEVATTDVILPEAEGDSGVLPGFYSDILIEQNVSDFEAQVGSSLTFNLTFTNVSGQTKSDIEADIFFVLENTTLDYLPENCVILESTDLLPVLSCQLGDLAANGKVQLQYSISTSESSHPLIYSTVVVDNDRSDAIVELYRDVITDTDLDGVSDFNEDLRGTDFLNALEGADIDPTTIDVLVAYTSDISEIYQGEVDTRINQLFNVANKIFSDSETGITLRAVGVHEVNYETADDLFTDLSRVTYQSEESLNDLGRMRALFGGDLVVLFRSGEINGLCGLANLGGKGTNGDFSADYHKDFAYSVINIDCMDDSVLAHEVGHNLGLVHSRREDTAGGSLTYSAGYGVDTRFVSVMAFPDDFDVVNRLYRFSDPERVCGPFPCGVDQDETDGADAVSALKLVKHQVSRYLPSQESRITTIKPFSSISGVINSTVGVGAYSGSSRDFEKSFSSDEEIDFRMKITPLPRQVGKEFVSYLVVMQGKNNLYQIDNQNNFIPWSGRLTELEALHAPRILGDYELFDVVKDLNFNNAGLTGKIKIFIAYRMVHSDELVYGATPFSISINEVTETKISDISNGGQ